MSKNIDFIEEAKKLSEYTSLMRRDFHMHPEIAFEELETAKKIYDELLNSGYRVTSGVGKTGVVATLGEKADQPIVMLRFDMDALPIIEENNVVYTSKKPGRMHACGHDAHMAIGLTVAKLFSKYKEEIPGTIKLVFQPAEEGTRGALAMIEDGVLENPRPDYALGCHVWNDKEVGWLGIVPGPFMAGEKDFEIEIIGRGGHGAIPNRTVDPIVAAAQIILAFQTIVSRNISPLQSGVISVTQVDSGTAFNIIPSKAILRGTLRYFESEVCDLIVERINNIVEGISSAMGCETTIRIVNNNPPVVNDRSVTKVVTTVAKEYFPDLIIDSTYQTMGAEDMADFINIIPGCFIFVGSANNEKHLNFGHHHPKFDIDESCLSYAVALLASSAWALMKVKK